MLVVPALVLLLAACGRAEPSSSPASISLAPSVSPSPSPAPASTRRVATVPEGFPVFPGASPLPRPGDPSAIAAWEAGRVGSDGYRFYEEALPRHGFPIVGLYPGGAGAIIRFALPGGEVRQLLLEPTPEGRMRITLRLDVP